MLYSKKGFPEESELVLATITSVQYNSVFVTLDEYGGKTGIIHISEIAPGRIRNIREYVTEGKKVILKVLRVNLERGHIDLSLRRVSDAQRRTKNTQLKQELLGEKILEFLATEQKKNVKEVYAFVSDIIFKHGYTYVYPCFEDVIAGDFELATLGLDKKTTELLDSLVRQRIKPPEVHINGKFTLVTWNENGVDDIRAAIAHAKTDEAKSSVVVKYLGAGKYLAAFTAPDYQTCEDIVEKVTQEVIDAFQKTGGEAAFDRIEE